MQKNLFLKRQHFVFLLLIGITFNCNKQDESHNNERQVKENQIDSNSVIDTLSRGLTFSIQVAAFQEKKNAEKLKLVLQQSEVPTYLDSSTNVSAEILYRLRIGPFSEEEQALDRLNILKKLGYSEAFIVKNNRETILKDSDQILSETVEHKKQLTFTGGCSHAKWSPNGREIAFFSRSKGMQGIYTIGTGGGYISKIIDNNTKRRITPKFSWSPSGDRIAFVAQEVNTNWEPIENLYLINKDGSGLKTLIRQDKFSFAISNIKWSPDGQRIAFNANYGNTTPQSDYIQRVLIISLNKMASNSPYDSHDVNAGYIIDPSYLEKTNWSVGWKTATEYLYLATFGNMNHSFNFAYEVWSYDVDSKERTVLLSGPAVKNCRIIELLPDKNIIVYNRTTQIIILDLSTGKENIVFDSQSIENQPDTFAITQSNYIFFLNGNELWASDLKGEKSKLGVQFNSYNFTLSPRGTKLGFEENGNLFTLKLSPGNKKARE